MDFIVDMCFVYWYILIEQASKAFATNSANVRPETPAQH